MLKELYRERYGGGDGKAINRHSERRYQDDQGNLYILSCCNDVFPRIFEAYGPFEETFIGVPPRLLVKGKEFWGHGISWKKAVPIFLDAVRKQKEGVS